MHWHDIIKEFKASHITDEGKGEKQQYFKNDTPNDMQSWHNSEVADQKGHPRISISQKKGRDKKKSKEQRWKELMSWTSTTCYEVIIEHRI